MPKYRKKPVVVEARQLSAFADTTEDLAQWCGGDVRFTYSGTKVVPHIVISTLEGEIRADPDDWIIQGVKGEFYPCKPDIFEVSYELVEE